MRVAFARRRRSEGEEGKGRGGETSDRSASHFGCIVWVKQRTKRREGKWRQPTGCEVGEEGSVSADDEGTVLLILAADHPGSNGSSRGAAVREISCRNGDHREAGSQGERQGNHLPFSFSFLFLVSLRSGRIPPPRSRFAIRSERFPGVVFFVSVLISFYFSIVAGVILRVFLVSPRLTSTFASRQFHRTFLFLFFRFRIISLCLVSVF